MALDKYQQELIKKAKAFAKEKTAGMPARVRQELEVMKPALQLLVNEKLPISHIMEFIHRETGLKLNRQQVEFFMREHFGYPPDKTEKTPEKAPGKTPGKSR